MVVQLEKQSINANATNGKGKESSEVMAESKVDEKAYQIDLKAGDSAVDKAIASRNSSFKDLQTAFAHGVWIACKHGRPNLLNKLFNKLNNADSNAIRSLALMRVWDEFGQGGIKDETDLTYVAESRAQKWIQRPVNMFTFKTTLPAGETDHIGMAQAGKVDGIFDQTKHDLIVAGKKAIVDHGIEALSHMDWISRAQVLAPVVTYDESWAEKLLTKALKAVAKKGALPLADLKQAARELGLHRSIVSAVEKEYPIQPDTPATETTPTATQAENQQVAA